VDSAGAAMAVLEHSLTSPKAQQVALPLSLLGVATVLVVMFGVHEPDPAQPAVTPPPSNARPSPAAPEAHAPPLDIIVDRALIDVLKHDGVPVPSHEYVTTRGHAVCGFLSCWLIEAA
jgi:hypothetical protein